MKVSSPSRKQNASATSSSASTVASSSAPRSQGGGSLSSALTMGGNSLRSTNQGCHRKIVGAVILLATIVYLQQYDFQFGKPPVKTKEEVDEFGRIPVTLPDDKINMIRPTNDHPPALTESSNIDPNVQDVHSNDDDDSDDVYAILEKHGGHAPKSKDDVHIDDDDSDDVYAILEKNGGHAPTYQGEVQIDDDNDDDVYAILEKNGGHAKVNDPTIAPTSCPFLAPHLTGLKDWKLYPPEAYDGLSLLRSKKESILNTAFPGCVPFVLFRQKLLLFTVLKVSSTVFTQLAKRLDGNPTWSNGCGFVQNPVTTNLMYLTDLPPSYAETLLLDSNWTKAIFVRDPKERVLSAYLDKAVENPDYTKHRCCEKKSKEIHALLQCHDPDSLPVVSFEDFLRVIVPHCNDGHWCRQSDSLRPVQWQQINFVGHFDRLEEDTRRLLEKVLGVWDEVGATGWPNGSLYAGESTVHHKTGAHDRMREYYTSELEDFVDEWFKKDYESPHLGLTKYRLSDP